MGMVTKKLISRVKHLIKLKGHKFVDLSAVLDMTPNSVTRLMAQSDMSLAKLEKIANFLNVDLLSLMNTALKDDFTQFHTMSVEQEKFFIDHKSYYKFFYLLTKNYTVDQIAEKFHLDHNSVVKYLTKLESIGVLKQLPKKRVQLAFESGIVFRPQGPIESHIMRRLFQDLQTNMNEKSQSLSKMGHGLKERSSFEEKASLALERSLGPYWEYLRMVVSRETYKDFVVDFTKLVDKYYRRANDELFSLEESEKIDLSSFLYIAPENWVDLVFQDPENLP